MFPKHPTRVQLILYVESILEGKGPIYSGIARHVSNCQQCREEVEAIKSSLKFFNTDVVAEPPEGLANEIIKQAREVNKKRKFERTVSRYRRPLITVVFCSIVWVAVGYYVFGRLYQSSDTFVSGVGMVSMGPGHMVKSDSVSHKGIVGSEDSVLWHQVEILGSVLGPILNKADLRTYTYIKMVSVIDEEMDKARKALERCPEDERIRRLIRDNMKEKVEVLKRIYKESVL